jgi:hypothetical protein
MARNLQGGIEQANLGFRAPKGRPADNSRDARKEVRNHGNKITRLAGGRQ